MFTSQKKMIKKYINMYVVPSAQSWASNLLLICDYFYSISNRNYNH